MSHFHPLKLSPDYVPIQTRNPITVIPKQIREVRTRNERSKFAKEMGVGMYFFIANKRDTRIRMMEILGKGDLRLGYSKILEIYKQTESKYLDMFKELRQNRKGTTFSLWMKRHRSFIATTEQDMNQAGGIRSYTAFRSARSVMKKYNQYKESK